MQAHEIGKKLAIIGCGKIGEALLAGLLDSGALDRKKIMATAAHKERCEALSKKYGIRAVTDNKEAVRWAEVVLIGLKPQMVKDVLKEIRPAARKNQLLISVAASVPTKSLSEWIGKPLAVVRAMPNTPCLIRQGMTAVSAGPGALEEHLKIAHKVFSCVGRVLHIEEKHLDAVTGLSASGPAYIYMVLESLAEGGVKVGLPREVATELAAQTALGSAKLILETKEHPAKLKDAVTTPAGCTIDGLLELEAGGLRVALIKAVVKATQRAKELVNG